MGKILPFRKRSRVKSKLQSVLADTDLLVAILFSNMVGLLILFWIYKELR